MPDVTVDARGTPIIVRVDNKITNWRLREFTGKERETLNWIDGFKPCSIMFDVGANVGSYTLYAASRGHTVVAFEPSEPNRVRLCENIALNNLKVVVLGYALADFNGAATLYMGRKSRGGAGSAEHSIGRKLVRNGETAVYGGEQVGTPVRSMDSVCAELGIWPDYIKIDTDGAEPRIIAGAQQALLLCRSVVMEADDRIVGGSDLPARMEAMGFTITFDKRKKTGRWAGHGNIHYARIA
jgi:FkbM family methyltransferase